ncbi:MAG TPA: PAS domain S-box protein, partial [Terriglobia bacterium]|nr:PAS domain S-box protein [Terriglobia bacterium]
MSTDGAQPAPAESLAVSQSQNPDHDKGLRHSLEHFRLFIENVREYAMFLLDTEGRITSWNRGAERIKGYKAPEILGKHFSIFYSPQDIRAGRPRHGLEKAAAEGQWRDEGWRLRKDGSKFWATVVITALREENGELKGFAKITRDLTERRRAEESLHELTNRILSIRDDERRRLARDLHDSTAQLLTALSLNLTVLEKQGRFAAESPAANALAECFTLAEQASQELRNFSYLLHPPLLDEAGLAPALQWYVDGFARRTQIKVRLAMPEDLGRLPTEIETALFRVVQECLTNVYRHSGSHSASVRVKKGRSAVCLGVRDAGRGIPEQRLESPHLVGVGLPGM